MWSFCYCFLSRNLGILNITSFVYVLANFLVVGCFFFIILADFHFCGIRTLFQTFACEVCFAGFLAHWHLQSLHRMCVQWGVFVYKVFSGNHLALISEIVIIMFGRERHCLMPSWWHCSVGIYLYKVRLGYFYSHFIKGPSVPPVAQTVENQWWCRIDLVGYLFNDFVMWSYRLQASQCRWCPWNKSCALSTLKIHKPWAFNSTMRTVTSACL